MGKSVGKMQVFAEVLILVIASVIPFLPGIQESFIFDDKPAILDNKVILTIFLIYLSKENS